MDVKCYLDRIKLKSKEEKVLMRVKRCILKIDKYVCLKKRVRVKKGTERN